MASKMASWPGRRLQGRGWGDSAHVQVLLRDFRYKSGRRRGFRPRLGFADVIMGIVDRIGLRPQYLVSGLRSVVAALLLLVGAVAYVNAGNGIAQLLPDDPERLSIWPLSPER